VTSALLSRAVTVCALLLPAVVGIVGASAQEMLSPKPMVEHPKIQSRPPANQPAENSNAEKPAASPSQAMAGPGAVKPDLSEEIGDWLLQCFSKAGRLCQISQRQVDPKNQALVMWVELTHFVAPKTGWQFVVMVPLGFRVAPNLGVRSGDELFLNMPILTCVPAGCAYASEIPVGGLETLRNSQKLATEIVDLKGQRYALNVSMRGFDKAFLKSALVLKE
jgi:invasion protein IalB